MAIHTFVAGAAFTAAQANKINTGADTGTYTPTLTGMAIGTGGSAANTAKFVFTGGVLVLRGSVVFGTTGQTFPTAPTISLPAGYAWADTAARYCGKVRLGDAGVGNFYGVMLGFSAVVQPVTFTASGTYLAETALSTTVPYTWAAGDSMTYEVSGWATG